MYSGLKVTVNEPQLALVDFEKLKGTGYFSADAWVPESELYKLSVFRND